MAFGTKVGYFRIKGNRLEHVYGVHYDMDTRGHGYPVFHAQLSSAANCASAIREQFHRTAGAEVVDRVRPILRNVRTPAPQMDCFSVVTQLCADHLMVIDPRRSDSMVTAACDGVRSACKCLQGAAHQLDSLNCGRAPRCYRSSHWYRTECEDPCSCDRICSG